MQRRLMLECLRAGKRIRSIDIVNFPNLLSPHSVRMYETSVPPSAMSLYPVVDLRSDTLTKPCQEMRKAMFEAEVGDDVYREDPTVLHLEERAANLLGKERALFVPTGTMGNLISMMVHCSQRGAEMLVGNLSHIFLFEQGGTAQIAGVQPRTLKNLSDGTFSLKELTSNVSKNADVHCATTSLICIENTHNVCGGKVLPLSWMDQLSEAAYDFKIPIHMDGARLFNAAVKLKVPAAMLVKDCSSCSVCLSKGLGAPIGSLIAGSAEFIEKALRIRKVLGGGMRQVGIIAAAGLVALDSMTHKLEKDHKNAQIIAQAIKQEQSQSVQAEPEKAHTNIVMVRLNVKKIAPIKFCKRMTIVTKNEAKELEYPVVVKMSPMTEDDVRICLHCGISQKDTEAVAQKLRHVIKEIGMKN